MTVAFAKPGQEIALQHIRWATYVALLEDAGEHRGARFAYDQGDLEIQMPSDRHEVINRLLAWIVGVVTEVLDLPLREFGSVTPLITRTQLTLWIKQSQQLETNALSKQIRQWIAAQQRLTDDISSPAEQGG